MTVVCMLGSSLTSPGRSEVKEMDDGGEMLCRRAPVWQYTHTHTHAHTTGGMYKADQMGNLLDCGINGKMKSLVTYGIAPQTFPNTR